MTLPLITMTIFMEGANAEIEQATWQLCERYDDVPRLSYTDCTTFAVMQQCGITTVFTSDEHFQILGFTIRP
jgi:predicted nucleic acid-binding protein